MWEAAVRGVEFFMRKCVSTQPGSHSTEVDKTEGPSLRDRPEFLATESSATIEEKNDIPSASTAPQPALQSASLPPENAPLPDQTIQAVTEPAPSAQPSGTAALNDVFQEWDEIEREERLVTAELHLLCLGIHFWVL